MILHFQIPEKTNTNLPDKSLSKKDATVSLDELSLTTSGYILCWFVKSRVENRF